MSSKLYMISLVNIIMHIDAYQYVLLLSIYSKQLPDFT